MNNILYVLSSFIILPLAFFFIFLFKEDKPVFFIISLLLFSFHSMVNLILYINIDIEKSLDPVITNTVLAFLFLFIVSKFSYNKNRFTAYSYIKRVILYGFGLYYFIEHIPLLRGIIVLIIASISVIVARIMGFDCAIGGIDYAGYPLFWQYRLNIISGNILEVNVPVSPTNIGIVLGCTGAREIILIYFFIMLTDANSKLKLKTFLINVVVIMVANIVRNVIVIYYTGYRNVPFEFTHHTIGSIIIFLALLFIVIHTLFRIPQINSHIEDIFGLKKIR